MNLLISFSGGRTSAMMAKICRELYSRENLLVVFANTGKEREETLDFVHECDRRFGLNVRWIEAEIPQKPGLGVIPREVCYETANRDGAPFQQLINKYGIPGRLARNCTKMLKIRVIQKFARMEFGSKNYTEAIGIRSDEPHRIRNKFYPLAELGITEKHVRAFWDIQDFDLGLKDFEGNCDLCFCKSKRKLMTIMKDRPDLAGWWIGNEIGSDKRFRPEERYSELFELSKRKFARALDAHTSRKKQYSLFDNSMDNEISCYCSNV